MRYVYDDGFRFATFFNSQNGMYVRTGILDENGRDTGVDPVRASFPHLIDIGIMGHCTHGLSGACKKSGINCYQQGSTINKPNMSFDVFKDIVQQCKNLTFQFALGGRGDPNEHEQFENILSECRNHAIVPNYTTSGFGLTDRQIDVSTELCGKVAVSWYGTEYSERAIHRFYQRGHKVNLHYVVTSASLLNAIELLSNPCIHEKTDAIIFLLYKPVGEINKELILSHSHDLLPRFFEKIVEAQQHIHIGFDSCFVPFLLHNNLPIDTRSIEPCESGRFSCYISEDNVMYPCSFIQSTRFGYSLTGRSIRAGWESAEFERFLGQGILPTCQDCVHYPVCNGGCPGIVDIHQCRR